MNKDKLSIWLELKFYLQYCVETKTKFEGINRKNPFRITLFSEHYIVTESVEDGHYPSCYVIKFETLLFGVVETIINNKEITSATQYAEEIEHSSIYRESNTKNKVGALTKYYLSIHKAFCETYQKKENANL